MARDFEELARQVRAATGAEQEIQIEQLKAIQELIDEDAEVLRLLAET